MASVLKTGGAGYGFEGSGDPGFSNPDRIVSSDNSYAAEITWATGPQKMYNDTFGFTTSDIPSGATIDGIKVEVEGYGFLSTKNINVALRFSAGDYSNTTKQLLMPTSEAWVAGGGASDLWGESSILDSAIRSGGFGVAIWNTSTTRVVGIDCVRITVYYTEAVPPGPPTDLECERQPTPSQVSEAPLFTAIYDDGASGSGDDATHYQIQVADNGSFTSPAWDSGEVALVSAVSHGNRCEEIVYDGSTLSSAPNAANLYYWRIRFKNTAGWGAWSDDGATDPAEFASEIKRNWPAAVKGYFRRHKLYFDTAHQGISAGRVQPFNVQTGEREVIASNGHFNESTQASGGFDIVSCSGKTHKFYLSELDNLDGKLWIYVVSQDHQTGLWGQPHAIREAGTTYDTHYFAVVTADNDNHLHVFYGCHNNLLRYVRTKVANVTGSLPGEPASGNWIEPNSGSETTYRNIANNATYPVAFTVRSINRVFVFYRATENNDGDKCYRYRFAYSSNNGLSWIQDYTCFYDSYELNPTNKHHRLYMYGVRFDEENEILHVSWTITHYLRGAIFQLQGIWYAYSIFDETDAESFDVGFNIWRWADGSIAGRTNMYGLPNAVCDEAWANVAAKAIQFHATDASEDDRVYSIFTEDLALTQDGTPIVFWCQRLWDQDIRDESPLCCAKWNSGTTQWDIIRITDQLPRRLMIRTSRSGLGLMTDRDGAIHAFMAVHGHTNFCILPTADVDSVGATPSSGSDNFAMVDDGLTVCDSDGTYVTLAAVTGKMSFTHSDSVTGLGTMLAVTVEAVCRKTSGDSTARLYLDIGGTEYESSDLAVDDAYSDYQRLVNTWETNPDTASDWAAAEINSLQFGIRNAHGSETFRVTRVILRVLYTKASDDELGSTEVWELISTDNGDTWKAREVTRNTGIGVPIMNRKHHLTNKLMEITWSTGHDIFYVTDRTSSYGLALPSGIDVRLFYAGAEIDRIIDYSNFVNSEVLFRIQEAIAAGRRAGPDDLYLYIGYPSEATQPPSDPNDIYAFQDNFEIYAPGASIDGVNGWTVVSGTDEIYASPPDESNKVWAGSQALHMTGTDAEISRTIGSGITNVYILACFWMEASGLRGYIEVSDGTNTFGVGLNNLTGYACYHINGTWYDHPSERAKYRGYYEFAIQVTSDGCTAWVDGVKIVSEAGSMTGVNTVHLKSGTECFWDYLRVADRLEKTTGSVPEPIIVVEEAERRGLAMDAVMLGTGQAVLRMDARLIWSTSARLPVESSQILHIPAQMPLETLRTQQIAGQLPVESTVAASREVSAPLQAAHGLAHPMDLPISFDGKISVTSDSDLPFVFSGSAHVESPLPIGSEHSLTADTLIAQVQISGALSYGQNVPISSYQGIQVDSGLPIETLQALESDIQLLIESLIRSETASEMPLTARQKLATALQLPLESLGQKAFDAPSMPLRWGFRMTADGSLPVVSVPTLAISSSFPIQSRIAISAIAQATIAIAKKIVREAGLPLEAGAAAEAALEMQIQSLFASRSAQNFPVAAAAKLLRSLGLPIAHGSRMESAPDIPIRVLEKLLSDQEMPISSDGKAVFSTFANLPISWQRSMSAHLESPIQAPASINVVSQRMMIENLTSTSIAYDLQLEHLSAMRQSAELAVAWLRTIGAFGHMQLSNLGTPSATGTFNLEFLKSGIVAESTFNIESLLQAVREADLPIQWQGIAILAMCIANARVSTLELAGTRVSTLTLRNAVIDALRLQKVKVSALEIENLTVKVAQIMGAKINGGKNGCDS